MPTASQCVTNLPSGDRQTLSIIAEGCDVNRSTAGRWLNGHTMPKGEKLLRLWTLLDLSGFDVEETKQLDETVKQLGQLVALKVVSPEEVQAAIGHSGGLSNLWQTLFGRHKLWSHNYVYAQQFVQRHSDALQIAIGQLPTLNSQLPDPGVVVEEGVQEPLDQSVETPDHVAILASYLRVALPLAELVESDSSNDADRKRLREMVGSEEFFHLTNLLHRLGSRRARNIY